MICCALQVMGAFQARAEEALQAAEAELSAAKERFAELAAYVNGAANAALADPQALFAVLATMAADLDAAHADNLVAAEKVPRPMLCVCQTLPGMSSADARCPVGRTPAP